MIANVPSPAPARRSLRLVSPVRIMLARSFIRWRPRPRKRGEGKRGRRLLPVAVRLVPLVDPAVAQLDVLIEVRRPGLDHLRVVARRIERRVLQRREVAELLDLHRLPFLRHAPVEETVTG